MKILRNPEIKRLIITILIFTVLACTTAFLINIRCSIFTFIVCALFSIYFLIFTYRRYKNIESISQKINQILNGYESLDFSAYNEGELSILQSEVYKMTVKLRQQASMLQNDKLYLSDSLANISHQLKTPLTSMNLALSRLAGDNLTHNERMEIVNQLRGLLSRTDWLITTLLKISKLDSNTAIFKKEQVEAKKLIDTALEPLLIPIEIRGLNIKTDIQPNIRLTCDINWTNEAISNIIKNCMEHTPFGGTLSVSCTQSALFTKIVISDTGPGISETDLPHIFKRFYRGKDSPDYSFGIGLNLASMIVSKQNGTIDARNLKGGGAQFIIKLYSEII